MNVKVILNKEAKEGLRAGINTLANAVSVTLGPKGRNVIMNNIHTGLHITKDGVTVAEKINLENEHENMGAQLLKKVASKTDNNVGDGTTTSIVLAQAMINMGLNAIEDDILLNPVEVQKGMNDASKEIIEILKEKAVPVDGEKIKEVATISANNDSDIGNLIGEAFNKIGKDGVITVEDSKTSESYIDIIKGIQFNKGFLSPYFVSDSDTMQCIYEKPYVLICNYKITQVEEIQKVISFSKSSNTPVLFICEDMTNEVLTLLVLHKLKNNVNIVAVKAPHIGVKKREYLDDLSLLTGAFVIDGKEHKLENLIPEMFGEAQKCVITDKQTLIINGYGEQADIEARIDGLRLVCEDVTKTDSEIDYCKERIAFLSGAIAVLYVGASSEVELKEKKDRITDAVNATKAAIEEGIIPGGGLTLWNIWNYNTFSDKGSKSYKEGVSIVYDAISVPFDIILSNGGIDVSKCIDTIKESDNWNYGFDALNEEFTDMMKAGIVDPVKVTRTALENAVSVAGMLLTTECVLLNTDKEKYNLPAFMEG